MSPNDADGMANRVDPEVYGSSDLVELLLVPDCISSGYLKLSFRTNQVN